MSIRIVTIVFAAVMAVALVCPCGAQNENFPTPMGLSTYVLSLNGSFAQFLRDVRGGAISAEVLEFREGTDDSCFSTKRLGRVLYGEFDVFSTIPPSQALGDWITESLTCEPADRDGSIDKLQIFHLDPGWSKDFFGAFISEITLPACDAASKNQGFLEVKFRPELIQRSTPSGPVTFPFKQKMWLASNFRLQMAGLDTTRVTRIEPITIKRDIMEFRDGTDAEAASIRLLAGLLHFSNIEVTLPMSKAASWVQWHEDMVVNGNGGPSNEKEGVLILYAPDLKTELARVLLHDLGIIQVEPIAAQQNSAAVSQVKAVMYCNSIEFVF